MRAVLDLLRPESEHQPGSGGRALIYVWALEQRDSRRGWDEGHEQDVMVPWVLKTGEAAKKEKGKKRRKEYGPKTDQQEPAAPVREDKTFLRYYHLYKKGELEHDIEQAGGMVVESGYEKDNWWAVAVLKGHE